LRLVSHYVAWSRLAIMLLAMDIVPESKRVMLLAAGDE
jgi:hypothetical protein